MVEQASSLSIVRAPSLLNFEEDEPLEDQLTFSNKVIKEVRLFADLINESVFVFYEQDVNADDLDALQHDIFKLVTVQVINQDVHKILLILARYKEHQVDKDLRKKIRVLRHAAPEDIGIDKYLLLNENSPLFKIVEQQRRTMQEKMTSFGLLSRGEKTVEEEQKESQVQRAEY